MAKESARDKIIRWAGEPNIVEELDYDLVNSVAHKVDSGFNEDLESMQEWLEDAKDILKMANLKFDPKDFPWEGAPNVIYPLISTACLQFASRGIPEILRNGKPVGYDVIGADPMGVKAAMGKRVTDFMNWQLIVESKHWIDSMERLLPILAAVGTAFKKPHWDPVLQRNMYELCMPDKVIINQKSQSLTHAPRITHILEVPVATVLERMAKGVYIEYDLVELGVNIESTAYEDQFIELIEQHCLLDLDGDGYPEPWIVTKVKDKECILRINARYNPQDVMFSEDKKDKIICIKGITYFIDYHFIYSPSGSFYSMGFGTLLLSTNTTINSLINSLLAAGQLASLQAGYIAAGSKIRGGNTPLRPGELKVIDTFGAKLDECIKLIDFKDPSSVLHELLTFLIQSSDKLVSVTQALTGQERTQNSPAHSMQAMVEQGLKVFTAIMGRVLRAETRELIRIYELNSMFLDPQEYVTVLGDPSVPMTKDAQGNTILLDFLPKLYAIRPDADPNAASDTQRAAKTQAILNAFSQPQLEGQMDPKEVLKRYLESNNIDNIATLMPPNMPPKPDPQAMQVQAQMQIQAAQQQLAQQKFQAEAQQRQAEFQLKILDSKANIELKRAQAALALSQAESTAGQLSIDRYQLLMDQVDKLLEDNQTNQDRQSEAENTALGMLHDSIQNQHDRVHEAIQNERDRQQSLAQTTQTNATRMATAPSNFGPTSSPTISSGEPEEAPDSYGPTQ